MVDAVVPGVRLTGTENGIGLGAAENGVRYSVHSTGRRTFSAGPRRRVVLAVVAGVEMPSLPNESARPTVADYTRL